MAPGAPENAIFICYRRDDANSAAYAIHERLKVAFGQRAVFLDHYGFQGGDAWREKTRPVIQQARAVVVVIHKDWITIGKGPAAFSCARFTVAVTARRPPEPRRYLPTAGCGQLGAKRTDCESLVAFRKYSSRQRDSSPLAMPRQNRQEAANNAVHYSIGYDRGHGESIRMTRPPFQFSLLALFGLMTAVAAAAAPRSLLSEVVLRVGVLLVLGSICAWALRAKRK